MLGESVSANCSAYRVSQVVRQRIPYQRASHTQSPPGKVPHLWCGTFSSRRPADRRWRRVATSETGWQKCRSRAGSLLRRLTM